MKRLSLLQLVFGGILMAVTHAAPAQAQATRTWVSGTGVDGNPCSRTAPCKTFAFAIGQTAAGGEISVMDPGGYGQVTINKAITINGEGTLASILAGSGSGIVVSAGATDKVILRNIMIIGAGGGSAGITINSGDVTVDKCLISEFTTGFVGGIGIFMSGSATTRVQVIDTNLVNNSHGMWLTTSSGFAIGSLDNVRISGSPGYGVISSTGGVIDISRSVVYNAGTGALLTNSSGAQINVSDSTLTNNAVAVMANASGSTINLSNVTLYNNTTGLTTAAGATIGTAGNNHGAFNGGALTTNGTVASF